MQPLLVWNCSVGQLDFLLFVLDNRREPLRPLTSSGFKVTLGGWNTIFLAVSSHRIQKSSRAREVTYLVLVRGGSLSASSTSVL